VRKVNELVKRARLAKVSPYFYAFLFAKTRIFYAKNGFFSQILTKKHPKTPFFRRFLAFFGRF
jgi:hypothetical protein